MPLVRISVSDKMAPEKRKKLPQAAYDAMRAAISIPENDLFVVLTPHAEGELVVDPHFMGVHRTDEFVLVHVTLRRGRTNEIKQAFYREVTRLFGERAGIAADDVMIVLSENDLADWSFGKGEAQYLLNPPAPAQKAGAAS